MRIDKWLWAARFFKSRSLAVDAIDKGRISLNEQVIKPSREVAVGDKIEIRGLGGDRRELHVRALSAVRGPAPAAQLLYAETPESVEARARAAEQRRLAPEPGQDFTAGRPTKRDRRDLARWRGE